eukprot:2078054-Prymnesium_polylepis.1
MAALVFIGSMTNTIVRVWPSCTQRILATAMCVRTPPVHGHAHAHVCAHKWCGSVVGTPYLCINMHNIELIVPEWNDFHQSTQLWRHAGHHL